jgi:cytochrome c oxidase assembly protein subunit 11
MMQPHQDETLPQAGRNRRLVGVLAVMTCGMLGLSFASVPLYNLFCRVTGFGGTTQVAEALPDRVLERTVTVRFNADVNQSLYWRFKPDQTNLALRLGEGATMLYRAENLESRPTVGVASYNVTPEKAGKYFHKVQCFCFNEQKLAAGARVEMPVYFYVDPAMAEDPAMDDVSVITLSYTFFKATDPLVFSSLAKTAKASP